MTRVLRCGALAVITVAAACTYRAAPPPVETPAEWKGSGLSVTRGTLTRGSAEAWGYGAYSYVLLPAAPESDPRYVALLEAYRSLPRDEPLGSFRRETPLEQRNITYVPVIEPERTGRPTMQWLLDHYDVECAKAWLHLRGLSGPGPFIVTSTAPLTAADEHSPIAVIDLSLASAASMSAWFEHFRRASEQPGDWLARGAELVLLRLHDILAEAGTGVILVIKALEPVGKVVEVAGVSP